MANALRRLSRYQIHHPPLPLQAHLPSFNGDPLPDSSDPRPPSPLRRPTAQTHQKNPLPDRFPLPISLHPLYSLSHYRHRRHRQTPTLLPRPLPLPLSPRVQTHLRAWRLLTVRDSSSTADHDSDLRSPSHSVDVARVCKVIEELIGTESNMESVLDRCEIDVSDRLVIDVIERFRHAHKPAYRFFRWAGRRPNFSPNSETYLKMLFVLGRTRQFESMISLLKEMGEKQILAMDAFLISIKSLAAAREMKKAVGIFRIMDQNNFEAGLETFNCLLGALAKAKLGKEAQDLFDRMKHIYHPDLKTYTVLLLGWCKIKNLVEASKIWNEMLDQGFCPDIIAHNIMFEGLIRCQRRSEAIKLFELMKSNGPKPNACTYTLMIRDLCKGGKMDNAMDVLREMMDAGCDPDVATYTCLLIGFGNVKQMDKVSKLMMMMNDRGCLPDGHTYNAMIKIMVNRKMPHDAAKIYKRMIARGIMPSIHTYNMMLKSFFRSNDHENGFAVWNEMNEKGVCPDDNSYTVLIGELIRHGRSDDALKYLDEMMSKGMKAPQLDYDKFVRDFSRSGNADVLADLARKINFCGKFRVSDKFLEWADKMKKM